MKRKLECAMIMGVVVSGVSCTTGQRQDRADRFIQHINNMQPEERPKDWEKTLALMARRAPGVGEVAPDFTLDLLDGSTAVTRSAFQENRPLVLIFGSYT